MTIYLINRSIKIKSIPVFRRWRVRAKDPKQKVFRLQRHWIRSAMWFCHLQRYSCSLYCVWRRCEDHQSCPAYHLWTHITWAPFKVPSSPPAPHIRRHWQALTWQCLHPATDLVHGGGAQHEEETEAADAGDHQHHGHSNEEGGGLERTGGDSGELSEAALAGQLPGESVSDAIVEKAEVAGLRRIHAIPDPIGLWEDGHVNDAEQDGEDGP